MVAVISFACGVVFGVILTLIIVQRFSKSGSQAQRQEIQALEQAHQTELTSLIQSHAAELSEIYLQHQNAINQARQKSVDASRNVIKGQVAEQLAPYLPHFNYLPSDARFIGDPIDYLVIDGYTNLKDGNGSPDDLQVVLIDIKSGKAKLSERQVAIQKTVEAGRVRFETIRIDLDHLPPPLEFLPDHADDELVPMPEPLTDPLDPLPEFMEPAPTSTPKITQIRQAYARAYAPWEKQEDFQLGQRFQQGYTIEQLAEQFQRQPTAIRSRLQKLKLLS